MDFLFLFLVFVLLVMLAYTLFRLYYQKTVACLVMAAGQFAVVAFLVFSYDGGLYLEPFVVLAAFLIGLAAPGVFLWTDLTTLRRKVRGRFGIPLRRFLYQNERDEVAKTVEKVKFVDAILRPRAENFPIEDILSEIRVERADTSKNVLKQLEAAGKKYGEGDYDGAYAAYETIERIFSRSPSLYFNMGNIDYIRGRFEAAARCYKRGAECAGNKEFSKDDLREKLGMIFYNLGNACFMSGKYARSIEAFKAAIEVYPANADAYFNLSFCHAMDFEETGDTEKAVEAFKKLVEDMPENLHAWYHFGKCLLKMGNYEQAGDCFLKVVGEDVMFHEGWYRLAISYDERGMVEEAARAYYTAIQIKPDFIDAYNNLGVLLSTIGRHGEALKVLRNALRLHPADTELIFNIGVVLYESGRFEDALGEFLSCDRLRPDDDTVLYMIAVNLMNLGRADESIDYLAHAIQKNPQIKSRAAQEHAFQEYVHRQEFSKLFV
ncbi:MAG: tetratricopeptide repeat protein [Clostridiales bacterium]|jgi:tetratricopeptide (TPR) repeat protein|nr:tetratricopeptide repeat protein [Clostridiales bacterium]